MKKIFCLFLRLTVRLTFRVTVHGKKYLKEARKQPVLLICNHISLLDGFFLYLFFSYKASFFLDVQVSKKKYVRLLMPFFDHELVDFSNPHSVRTMIRMIEEGKSAVIFPEGRITTTGKLMSVQNGAGLIAYKTSAPIFPVQIEGLQNSIYSKTNNILKRRWFPKVTLNFFSLRRLSINPSVRGEKRRILISTQLYEIMRENVLKSSKINQNLYETLLDTAEYNGKSMVILEDQNFKPITYKRLIIGTFALGKQMSKFFSPNESNVGILLPNSVGCLTCFFSALLYGKVPAMINFTAGKLNILQAIKIGRISVVFTSRKFVAASEMIAAIVKSIDRYVKVVYLEDLAKEIGIGNKLQGAVKAKMARKLHKFYAKVKADDPAAILFTSGSEGVPKGVVLSHKNILTNCVQAVTQLGINQKDSVLNPLPMFHSLGLTAGTLFPLFNGIYTFLYPSPLHYRIIPKIAYEKDITVLLGTNTLMAGYGAKANPHDFYKLRIAVCGGEQLKEEVQNLWNEKFGIRLLEGYGTTETSPGIALNSLFYYKKGSVGRLIVGMDYKVIPFEGLPVSDSPLLHRGVLSVKGDNVMLGYLSNDGTGKIEKHSLEWYDTGDVVEVDYNRFITIIGRVKRFSKIGGEMVSHALVEAHVSYMWSEYVHAIIGTTDAKKGEQLVWVTNMTEARLSDLPTLFREEELPSLMMPRKLLIHPEIPLLGTGKVDYPAIVRLWDEKNNNIF